MSWSHHDRLRRLFHMEHAVSVSAAPAATDRVEAAFLANKRRLSQFLVQTVGDRALAEDLLQETFVAAYQAREKAEQVANLDAWLYGIARHRALRALRRTQRMRRALTRVASRAEAATVESPEVSGVLAVLDRVLDPGDRSLVILRYVHDMDATQLAELTGRSPAAIRKRLERARKALAEEIER